MKPHPAPPPDEPTEAEIQHAAYMIWIDSGCPSGSHAAHWLAAKELLSHRHDPAPVTGPPVSDPIADATACLPPPVVDSRAPLAQRPGRRHPGRAAHAGKDGAPPNP